MSAKKKGKTWPRCSFPRCTRRDEHDGDHSLRPVKRAVNPASLKNLKPFPKGVSGNPSGKRNGDFLKELFQNIIENNAEAIGKAYLKQLKRGSLGALSVIGERAYGPPPKAGAGDGVDSVTVKIDFDR